MAFGFLQVGTIADAGMETDLAQIDTNRVVMTRIGASWPRRHRKKRQRRRGREKGRGKGRGKVMALIVVIGEMVEGIVVEERTSTLAIHI